MIYDSVIDSLKYDWKKAIMLYSPILASLGLWYGMTELPIYYEQRGLIIVMVNYVISVMTFNLMMHNMTGKPFQTFQPIVLLLTIPFICHYSGVGGA